MRDTRAGDGARAVLEAVVATIRTRAPAVIALVIETEGSTYVDAGAMTLFGAAVGQVGWLSGGCLEPEIERYAQERARASRDSLAPRLRSPVGLKLGGSGPQAIALSIAAQLQAWRNGEASR